MKTAEIYLINEEKMGQKSLLIIHTLCIFALSFVLYKNFNRLIHEQVLLAGIISLNIIGSFILIIKSYKRLTVINKEISLELIKQTKLHTYRDVLILSFIPFIGIIGWHIGIKSNIVAGLLICILIFALILLIHDWTKFKSVHKSLN